MFPGSIYFIAIVTPQRIISSTLYVCETYQFDVLLMLPRSFTPSITLSLTFNLPASNSGKTSSLILLTLPHLPLFLRFPNFQVFCYPAHLSSFKHTPPILLVQSYGFFPLAAFLLFTFSKWYRHKTGVGRSGFLLVGRYWSHSLSAGSISGAVWCLCSYTFDSEVPPQGPAHHPMSSVSLFLKSCFSDPCRTSETHSQRSMWTWVITAFNGMILRYLLLNFRAYTCIFHVVSLKEKFDFF